METFFSSVSIQTIRVSSGFPGLKRRFKTLFENITTVQIGLFLSDNILNFRLNQLSIMCQFTINFTAYSCFILFVLNIESKIYSVSPHFIF